LDPGTAFALALAATSPLCKDDAKEPPARLFYSPTSLSCQSGRRELLVPGNNASEAVVAEFVHQANATLGPNLVRSPIGLLAKSFGFGSIDLDDEGLDDEDLLKRAQFELRGIQALRLEPVMMPTHVAHHEAAGLAPAEVPLTDHANTLTRFPGHNASWPARSAIAFVIVLAIWLCAEAHSGRGSTLDALQRILLGNPADSESELSAADPAKLPRVLYLAIPVKFCILALYPACFIGIMHAEHWSLAQLALTATCGRAAGAFGGVGWGGVGDS
jgi:hypothetical protein